MKADPRIRILTAWDIIDKAQGECVLHGADGDPGVNAQGYGMAAKHPMRSLRLLGSVGRADQSGSVGCGTGSTSATTMPIVDTWWQTETGMIMMRRCPVRLRQSPPPPLPAARRRAAIVDKDGVPVPKGSGGFLILKQPWPAMLRTIYGDPGALREPVLVRYRATTSPAMAPPGRGRYYWVMGRMMT